MYLGCIWGVSGVYLGVYLRVLLLPFEPKSENVENSLVLLLLFEPKSENVENSSALLLLFEPKSEHVENSSALLPQIHLRYIDFL